jgi:hypothetical protein
MYVFMVVFVDLRTNSDYVPIELQVIGFFNQERGCLLCSTNLILNMFQVTVIFQRVKYSPVDYANNALQFKAHCSSYFL